MDPEPMVHVVYQCEDGHACSGASPFCTWLTISGMSSGDIAQVCRYPVYRITLKEVSRERLQ